MVNPTLDPRAVATAVRTAATTTTTITTTATIAFQTTTAKGLKVQSAQSCSQLMWDAAGTNHAVCGYSKMGGACKKNVDWATAHGICNVAGARLCSVDELRQNAAAGTGCNFDVSRVWASGTCAAGSEAWVALGKYNVDDAPACLNTATKRAVRCCADVFVPPATTVTTTTTVTSTTTVTTKTTTTNVLSQVCACAAKHSLCGDTCSAMETMPDNECMNAYIGAVCSQTGGFSPLTKYYTYCPSTCPTPPTSAATTATTKLTATTVATKTSATTATTVTTKTTTPVPITTHATTATTAKMAVATTPVPITARATVAHAVQTNVQASTASFKTCTELGWAFKLANTHVCGASKINGKCHKGSATLAKASKVCKKVGGRLCSVHELTAGVAHDTGCGLGNQWVWTSTACEGGAMVALGKHQSGESARCVDTGSSSSTHSVRCCADRTSVTATAPVVIKKTPSSVPSVVSAAACITLGWQLKLANTHVCGASKINGKCHKGSATLAKASKVCQKVGARLCSVQELAAGAAHDTGCGMDSAWVWTSTGCDGGTMIALGKHQPEQPAQCSKMIDINGKHSVRCCADTTSVPVTAPVIIKNTPSPAPLLASAAACATLEWAFTLGNTRVCGASKINGKCYKNSATLAKASKVCGAVGARLCSVQELAAGAAHDTGCGMDSAWVWTSTTCEGGAMITLGKHQPEQPARCSKLDANGKVHSVRCCADATATAPSRRSVQIRGRDA